MPGELIPIIGIIFGCMIPITAIWAKHRQKVAQMQVNAASANSARHDAQTAAQVQALEDRVRVLERIVTDKGYDVASQIEALRDTPENRPENRKADAGVQIDFHKEKVR